MSVSQHFCEAIHYLSQIVDFTLVSSSRSREENSIKKNKKHILTSWEFFQIGLVCLVCSDTWLKQNVQEVVKIPKSAFEKFIIGVYINYL